MIDLGTGNNNKINWALEDKQEFIDIVETVFRGARKGRGLVVSPKVRPRPAAGGPTRARSGRRCERARGTDRDARRRHTARRRQDYSTKYRY